MITLTMDGSIIALTVLGRNRCPVVGIGLRSHIRVEEDLKVMTTLNALLRITVVEACMSGQVATGDLIRITVGIIARRSHTQVEEILQQVETALVVVAIVVDINLAGALHIGMVDIQVVILIVHHSLQVVVVGHTERHIVRIGLTKIGLRIVGQILTVLIPVDRRLVGELLTVAMTLGILLSLEDLPATTHDLIGTRLDGRLHQTHIIAWQGGCR